MSDTTGAIQVTHTNDTVSLTLPDTWIDRLLTRVAEALHNDPDAIVTAKAFADLGAANYLLEMDDRERTTEYGIDDIHDLTVQAAAALHTIREALNVPFTVGMPPDDARRLESDLVAHTSRTERNGWAAA